MIAFIKKLRVDFPEFSGQNLCPMATSGCQGGWQPAFPGSGIGGLRRRELPWALV